MKKLYFRLFFAKKCLRGSSRKHFLSFAAFPLRKGEERGVEYLKIKIEEEIVDERHNDYHCGQKENEELIRAPARKEQACVLHAMIEECNEADGTRGGEELEYYRVVHSRKGVAERVAYALDNHSVVKADAKDGRAQKVRHAVLPIAEAQIFGHNVKAQKL